MNWNEATLEGCRDGLAEFKGWELTYSDDETQEPFWYNENGRPGHIPCQTALLDHPIPDTIDAIAASLPEGCCWWFIRVGRSEHPVAEVLNNDGFAYRAYADTEILARARAACLAWEASSTPEGSGE